MGNEVKFSGNVPVFNTDGQLAFCLPTCGDECSHAPSISGCGGTIPKYIKATWSGITDCGGGECSPVASGGSVVMECVLWIYNLWQYTETGLLVDMNFSGSGGGFARVGTGNPFSNTCFKHVFTAGEECTCSGSVTNDYAVGDCDCNLPLEKECGHGGTFVWVTCDSLGNECDCEITAP